MLPVHPLFRNEAKRRISEVDSLESFEVQDGSTDNLEFEFALTHLAEEKNSLDGNQLSANLSENDTFAVIEDLRVAILLEIYGIIDQVGDFLLYI